MTAKLMSTILLFFLFYQCHGVHVLNLFHPADKALIKLSDYDSTARPPGLFNPDDPVNVTVNMFVRRIERIDHLTNELEIQITFREEWFDTRLTFSGHDVATNEVSLFWKPDVFFSNEKKGHLHTITKPNIFARLQNDGRVMLSERISLTLNCPMKLWNFPFDRQYCELRMPSYGYTTNDVTLSWKDENPVQVANHIWIPGYSFASHFEDTCDSKTNTGDYSCLSTVIELHRIYFPYIIRVYMPMILLVLLSWSSFWLPASAVTERLAVGLLTTLTTALLLFRDENFMRLPSLTKMDVWTALSAFTVIAAFFEFVLIAYLTGNKSEQPTNHETEFDVENAKKTQTRKFMWMEIPRNVHRADAISKICFPITYTLVCLLFGPILNDHTYSG